MDVLELRKRRKDITITSPNLNFKFINFYNNFGKEVKNVSKDNEYGNAIETVNYSTDGEASDWMLGEKNIISFSPELGSKNPKA